MFKAIVENLSAQTGNDIGIKLL